MYHPNFCAECGKKIFRLHWHPWHSRVFCNECARRLRRLRLKLPLIFALTLFSAGFIAGRAGRPDAPPLVIERSANSPLFEPADKSKSNTAQTIVAEEVYTCGARTKKGTPCSRRVHGPVRCWQHKGMSAMLPQEKLRIKEEVGTNAR
jgi:hypothetical protein